MKKKITFSLIWTDNGITHTISAQLLITIDCNHNNPAHLIYIKPNQICLCMFLCALCTSTIEANLDQILACGILIPCGCSRAG